MAMRERGFILLVPLETADDDRLDVTSPAIVVIAVRAVETKRLKAGHAGFPCSSFSQAPWPPLRDSEHVSGLPGLNRTQQEKSKTREFSFVRCSSDHEYTMRSRRGLFV